MRAYVYISGAPASSLAIDTNNMIIEYRVWFNWKNVGLTPAMECAMWTSFQQVDISQPMPTPFTKAGKKSNTVPLGPKQGIQGASVNISPANLANIFAGKARCYVWGLAEYRDIYSRPDAPIRHTEICLEVIVNVDPSLPVNPAQPPKLFFQGIEQQNSSS